MIRKIIIRIIYPVLMVGIVLSLVVGAQAQTGNIDPTNKWAWGTNIGWINFRPAHGGVTVYSDHLEGHAWAENVGWIRLGAHTGGGVHTYANTSHTDYGVNHDGAGNLSGYAWGTNVGWINFNPTHSEVTIDPSTGSFDGYAWSENVGWIHFQHTSPAYKVATLDVIFTNGADASLSFAQTNPAPPQDNWPLGQFSLNSSSTGAMFNACTVSLGGSYSSGANPFRLCASDTNAFSSASAIGSDAAASGGSVTFGSLGDALPSGARYYWVTADLSASASGTIHGTIAHSGALDITDGTISGSSNYGVLNTDGDVPLPVELSSFTASVHPDGIQLQWVTESEVDNLGFNLYRAEENEGGIGEYVQLNADLIRGAGNAPSPRVYRFVDRRLRGEGIYWYRLEDVSLDGKNILHDPISITVRVPQEIVREIPTAYKLHQNHPNPFNPSTTIAYDLSEASHVRLTIYSIAGQRVATLMSAHQEAGHYEVTWNGSGFANGVYLYRLEAGDFVETQRMVLLK